MLGFEVLPLMWILGIVTIALAIALRPLFENFAAGVTLQTRRPFEPGDQVTLNGELGQVREVTARTVWLEALDGRHIHVPNRLVLDNTIINYTAGEARRSSLRLGLDYGADLPHATALITDAARRTAKVRETPAPQVLVQAFGDSSVDVTVQFWHGPEISRGEEVCHDAAVNIKQALDEAGIVIALPQRVLHEAPLPSTSDGRAP